MRRRLAMMLAAGSVLMGLVAGGTMALFSAKAGTFDGEFVAGTLCIDSERNDSDPVPGPMFYVTPEQGATPKGRPGIHATEVWAPGDEHTRTLVVFNDERRCPSTLDAWLDSVHVTLSADSYAAMAEQLLVKVISPEGGRDVLVGEGLLSEFLAGPVALRYADGARVPLLADSNRQLHFSVEMDRAAGNEFQEKTLIAHFHVNAVQMQNND